MATAGEYLLGHSAAEQVRLQAQADELALDAAWLLDRLFIPAGGRAIDLGCGPRGVLDLLAARVGPGGSVVGIDRSPDMVQLARAFLAERGLANVTVGEGDAGATGLPRGSFDAAHLRLVLVNVPDPERIVAELVALVRPGGAVAVQEVDFVSSLCQPPLEAWDRLGRAFAAHSRAAGIDLHIGRRVPGLLRAAGVVDVQVHPVVHVYPPGHPHRQTLLRLVEAVQEQLVAQGILAAGELTELKAAVQAHLDDPATLVVSNLFIQAWGRTQEAWPSAG
jgi:SAM-dependent methyltransferase